MFIDINKIEPEGLSFERSLEPGFLGDRPGEDVRVERASLSGTAVKTGRGVELRARLDAIVGLSCSRCLERFDYVICRDFFLVLVADAVEFSPRDGAAVSRADTTLYYTRDGKAALTDIASEQLYLHLPLKPICRRDCRGLCPRCGAELNRQPCDCDRSDIDPRLAPLLELKKHEAQGKNDAESET